MGLLKSEPQHAVMADTAEPRRADCRSKLALVGRALPVAMLLLPPLSIAAPAVAQADNSPGLPTRLAEAMAAARDRMLGGANITQRYGNWLGPGWWGGSELDSRSGMLAPIDDLDAAAQKHDFGYQIAEELGRGRPGVTGAYKLMADIIAIRDTKALDPDPSRWAHPPADPALAQTFVARLIISFEEWQTRYNRFKSIKLGPSDVGDLDTLNRILDDDLPDQAKFETMQKERIRDWNKRYADLQRRNLIAGLTRPAAANASANPSPPKAPPPATPPAASSGTSLTLELPGYWGHLSYTISGAQLDPPTGGDRGNVAGRSYTGRLSGPVLTVSGTGVSDNESSGPGTGDYYILHASVTAGANTRTFDYTAARGERLNRPFNLSVPVPDNATSGSFSIRLLEINANYGDHGWVVSGSLSGPPARAKPAPAPANRCPPREAGPGGKPHTVIVKDAQNRIQSMITYGATGEVLSGHEMHYRSDGSMASSSHYRCVDGVRQAFEESSPAP